MGELIRLDERRRDRSRPRRDLRPAVYFDVGCPLSYLACEQVERVLGDVDWIPVSAGAVRGALHPDAELALRERADLRARALRLPLIWPERFPAPALPALRAAVHAAEQGSGARFALAASRLAFCGGFDLEDPEVLAEAAAAAGVGLQGCLRAAGDTNLDPGLQATARGLRQRGVTELPAIRIGRRWCTGDAIMPAASAMLQAGAVADPLAPVG